MSCERNWADSMVFTLLTFSQKLDPQEVTVVRSDSREKV
jgi:hypothetical protein